MTITLQTQRKLLKIMRISMFQAVIALTCAGIAQAHTGKAQQILESKVTVQVQNLTIDETLKQIEKAANVRFMYSPEIFDNKVTSTFSFKNSKLEKVLNNLLAPHRVNYKVEGRDIILTRAPKDKTSIDPVATDEAVALAGTPVTGTIVDEKGEPVIGATVSLKGTTYGVITDMDGKFTINIPEGGAEGKPAVLVFSLIGYQTQEVLVGNQTTFSIKLVEAVKTMDEVVVVGYGEQKKATLSGAVTVVDDKLFKDRGVVDNPLGALQGQVAGAMITRNSAAPGRNSWNIQIRGASSVNNTPPLVVIDGVPVSADGSSSNDNTLKADLGGLAALNSMNPNDIESITVLKDGSAAIYGARAAGGVILVTTKRAKTGKPVIQYDGSVSAKVLGLQPQLLNVNQFGTYLSQGVANDFYNNGSQTGNLWYKMGQMMISPPASGFYDLTKDANGNTILPAQNPNNPGFGDVKDLTFFNNNMVDVLWGSATSTQHNLSISNRTDKSGYRISLGYLGDGSNLQWGQNSSKRYNARLSHDYSFSEKLKLETNISYERTDVVMPTLISNVMGQYQQPGLPVLTQNGKPYAWGTQYTANAQAAYGGESKEQITRLYTNTKLTYSIFKDLKFIGIAGMNNTFSNVATQQKNITWYNYVGDIQLPDNPTQTNTYYQKQNVYDIYYNLNGYLNYTKTIANDHNIGVTLGVQFESEYNNTVFARTSNLANNNVPSLNLGIGDLTTKTVNEAKSQWAIASYFSRLNYNYKGKYMIEGNFRYDGSSRFDATHRWHSFAGVSGGWVISEEKFMQNMKVLSNLKLRASWGQMGNQLTIGPYDYIQTVAFPVNTTGAANSLYPYLGSGQVVIAGPSGVLVDNNRIWETVQTLNFGLDFAFLNNRLSGSFDYFIKENKNMLLAKTLSGEIGALSPTANLGYLRTNGWELALGWRDKIGEVTYRISGNITDNKNTLVDYKASSVKTIGYNGALEGYSMGTYWGLEYAGRIQTQEQADAYNNAMQPLRASSTYAIPNRTYNTSGAVVTPGLRPGDNMYKDQNGDGKLTVDDLVLLGTDAPRYSFGMTLGLEWKGFDFTAIFQGVGQRTIYRDGNWGVPFGSIFQGQTNFWVGNTWTPDNTGAFYPIISTGQNGTGYNTWNYYPSTWSVQNGAYLRLKNIVLGYTLPAAITKKIKIEKLRVYVSGSDVWEVTGIRDGWDPEVTRTAGRTTSGSQNALERYPFFRLFTGGVNVTF